VFDGRAIEKIKALRAAFPDAILEVDGGITPVTAARAKDAGADIVVSSSYIWSAESPHEAYEKFLAI
jgi:pentose-5-phosphate-3-epimerase